MSRRNVLLRAAGLEELEAGIWYMAPCPREQARIYTAGYADRFASYIGTGMNTQLQGFRLQALDAHWNTGWKVLDFGAGAGAFALYCHSHGVGPIACFDTNPECEKLLRASDCWFDPRDETCPTRYVSNGFDLVTFFDSLEHLRHPALALRIAKYTVLVTIPIVRDVDHLLVSKHLKPSEHVWYFTDAGFRLFMRWHGFKIEREYDDEQRLGREDVRTYVCVRKGA